MSVGRNDPCPCGSGKKHKHCCLLKGATPVKQANVQATSTTAAWNLFRQGLINDAEMLAHEALQQQPNQADVHHLLGAIALHHGKTLEAIAFSKQAIKLSSKNPEFFNNLGLAYHERGLTEEAIAQYRHAIKVQPRYADAYYNLHAALMHAHPLSEAVDSLKAAIQWNPQDIEAVFMLHMLSEYLGLSTAHLPNLDFLKARAYIIAARVDAWEYLKSQGASKMPISGSARQTFEIAKKASNVEGLVLEFGVRFGNSIHMLAELFPQAVHGFDSFEGLPDEWHHEPKGSYSTKGVIPIVPENVQLHAGWFDQTLPAFLAQHAGPVKFINVDCDIYSSTKTVLDLLAPRMQVGTVIVFDEYIGNAHWREDEHKAFQEAVTRYGWQYEYLCFSFFTKQVAVRLIKV